MHVTDVESEYAILFPKGRVLFLSVTYVHPPGNIMSVMLIIHVTFDFKMLLDFV